MDYQERMDHEEMEATIWILVLVCLIMAIVSALFGEIRIFIFSVLTAIVIGLGKFIKLKYG